MLCYLLTYLYLLNLWENFTHHSDLDSIDLELVVCLSTAAVPHVITSCLPRCQCGVWYCGPRNPSRASLYFIRTLRYGVRMVGVIHHWPSTDHFTSIQGSLWRSSEISVRTGFSTLRMQPDLSRHLALMLTFMQMTPNCMAIVHLPILLSWRLEFFELLTQFTSGCLRTGSLSTQARQFIWLGTKHSLAKRDTDRLFSLLTSLTELTSVRNLGFIIDQELNMKDHITKLCQSCYYQLRKIRKAQPSVVVPGSAPGPSISEGTILSKRFLRLLTPAVELTSCTDIRLLHNEHQLFRKRL